MNSQWLNHAKLVTPQRTAAVGLLLVQIVAIGLFMEARVFAACAAIIALTGWLAPQYKMLREFDRTRWFTIFGILFALKTVFAPTKFEADLTFVNTEMAYEIACYCIVIQLLVLFMKRYQSRLPLWILGVSVISLIFISDIRVTNFRRTYMLVTVFLFLWAWCMYASTSRTEVHQRHPRSWFKFLLASSVLCCSLIAGTVISIQLHQHERHLESMLTAYLAMGEASTAETGFSGRGGLSDVTEWKKVDSRVVALRVKSVSAPGYLRGRVFDTLERHRWEISGETVPLRPARNTTMPGFSESGDSIFFLAPGTNQTNHAGEVLRVWPVDQNSAGHFFLPLDATAIACPVNTILADKHRIVLRTDQGDAHPYSIFVSQNPLKELLKADVVTTALPENIDPRILSALNELQLVGKSNREKMRTVSQFFQQNFQYHLGIRVPHGEDRLGYFIGEKAPAHCEYFASATTVMLRLANVPARYVTGYVCAEQNALDGTWLARRQDAHAWVEAYDDVANEWVIVESTPEGGVPVAEPAGLQSNLVEWFVHWIRTLQYFIRHGDFWSLIWMGLKLLFWVILVSASVLGVTQLLQLLKRKLKPPVFSEIEVDPRVQAERKSMDRYLARYGLTREDHEPILKFSRRIQQRVTIPHAVEVAQWYDQYLSLRFGNDADIDQSLQLLKSQRKEITSRKQM